jgi:uncharacterized YceG family protein
VSTEGEVPGAPPGDGVAAGGAVAGHGAAAPAVVGDRPAPEGRPVRRDRHVARRRTVRRRRIVLGVAGVVLLMGAALVAWYVVPSHPQVPTTFDVKVLPGYTVAEVAQAVGTVPGRTGNDFAATVRSGSVRSAYGTPSSTSLEGLLGTGTYQVTEGESDQRLLGQMVSRFDRQARAAGLTQAAASALGMTPYQVVTVASIAQKEGYFDRYMGKVARVVYNRLAAGMHLDMTSTVLYAVGQDGGTVTQADHTLDSPYNTYLNAGLTPTPICLPSLAALAAAVSPPAGTWLYFTVVDKAGTTRFADTYTEQLANEALAKKNGVG